MRGHASAQDVGLCKWVVFLWEHGFDFSVLVWVKSGTDQPRSLLKKGRATQSGRLLLSIGHQFAGSGSVGWRFGVDHHFNDAGSGLGCLLGAGSCQCVACGCVCLFGVYHAFTMGRAARFPGPARPAGGRTRAPARVSMVSGLRAVGMAKAGRRSLAGLLPALLN